MAGRFTTIDEYVAALPEGVRPVLEEVRRVVHRVVPDAGETISYQMPTFVVDGLPLVHVAAWKNHLGLYPLPAMDGELAAAVEPYRGAKDAMQLRYDRPVPWELVERVVAAMLDQRRTGGS